MAREQNKLETGNTVTIQQTSFAYKIGAVRVRVGGRGGYGLDLNDL